MTLARDPAPLEIIARAVQREVLPGAVISHATAAELLGLWLPRPLEHATHGAVHCTVPPERRRWLTPNVVVHTGPSGSVQWTRGVRVSGAVEVLCELSADLSADELVAACDSLVGPRGPRPGVTLPSLRELVARAPSIRGIKKVRRAVASSRERVESPKETELRLLLLAAGFVEPVVNLPVKKPGSSRPYRIDLAYPEERIAIEYDGDWHRTDRRRHREDIRKDDILHSRGWRVIRVTDDDLRRPAALFAVLTEAGAPLAGRRLRSLGT